MKRTASSYQAKVTVDTGMARARVPAPLLRVMGARPGNYLIFRFVTTGEAVVRLSRVKPSKGKGR